MRSKLEPPLKGNEIKVRDQRKAIWRIIEKFHFVSDKPFLFTYFVHLGPLSPFIIDMNLFNTSQEAAVLYQKITKLQDMIIK